MLESGRAESLLRDPTLGSHSRFSGDSQAGVSGVAVCCRLWSTLFRATGYALMSDIFMRLVLLMILSPYSLLHLMIFSREVAVFTGPPILLLFSLIVAIFNES